VIEQILPDDVVVVDTREDLLGIELFPEEEASVGNAVEKRRREFVTVRACARQALQRLGLPPQAIPSGERGEPRWPAGIVGSITHCDGYRACVLAHASSILTVGVDAEPNAPLPDGLLADIARPEERPWLARMGQAAPAVHWDRLLFSAKEATYKAWFPLARRWLGFEDAIVRIEPQAIVRIEPQEGVGGKQAVAPRDMGSTSGAFSVRLLVEGPPLGDRRLTGFSGRWLVRDGLVLTAIAMKRLAEHDRPGGRG
jgi:4'-phosphopantetheinyl transferase EntD